MKKEKIPCKCPLCVNYDYGAENYCCDGCVWDHKEYIRIYREGKYESRRISTNKK